MPAQITLQEILSRVGIEEKKEIKKRDPNLPKPSVVEEMEEAGLTNENLFQELATIILNGDKNSDKLKAIQMVLQSKNIMKPDNVANVPAVQIIINDPGATAKINPILIPRELDIDIPVQA